MTTPPSEHKRSDSRHPPMVEGSSEIKKVQDVRDRPEVQPLNAAGPAAGTPVPTLPSVDTLNEDSDVSAFMTADIHEPLRQTALHKLFHLPKFNRRDGLDDYDDDYRSFKPLGDILTSDRRHQLERLELGAKTGEQPLSDSAAKATAELGEDARYRQQHHELAAGPAGGTADRSPGLTPACVLCRRANRYTHPTSESVHCAQWFEQCMSRAPARTEDSAQIAIQFDGRAQISSKQIQAGTAPSDAQGSRLSSAVHAAIKDRIESGQGNPAVVFHDAGLSVLPGQNGLPGFPEEILWFPVSSSGLLLDLCLATVAWGADRVVVVIEDATGTVWPRLDAQMAAAEAVFDGLGLEKERLRLIRLTHFDSTSLSAVLAIPAVLRKLRPAFFEPVECGRAMVYSAVDTLLAQTAPLHPATRLPQGLPFGDVHINTGACTLCMACVAACPTAALRDGGKDPQILFEEERCVQCGLCRSACPEAAIGLIARMVFDRRARRAARRLHHAEPIGCVVCGRPFAVGAMVDSVAQRLANHWMYQSESAKRRLRMCRDCRVQDFIRENARPDRKTPIQGGH